MPRRTQGRLLTCSLLPAAPLLIAASPFVAPARSYKSEIRREDKDALRALLRKQFHHLVTPEILRELDASRSR